MDGNIQKENEKKNAPKNVQSFENEIGTIRISTEVVAIIAGMAAAENPGVYSMSAGFAGGITEALGRKSQSKGVKVESDGENASIGIYLIVNYGYRIPDVAWSIQENVKKTVQEMTGLNVTEVNIHVQGINFDQVKEEKKQEFEQEQEAQAEYAEDVDA
jgi:uncharacterized alkaline shock family protein YloU